MTDDPGGNGADEDIPLDIAGHESRDRPQSNGTTEAVTEADGELVTDFSVTDERTNGDGGNEVEPVEVLVAMAKDGDIDPWDIDIVAVTDEFFDRLDDADLRTGGRALFYASVLLRMKSDAMMEDDEPEPEQEPWDEPMDTVGNGHDPFVALEREMDRRLERKHARGTPQTLDELVRELRERERENYWKESRSYDTSDSPHGFSRGTQTLDYRTADALRMDDEPTEEDVTGHAHDEHMEDLITEVYMALREQYDKGRDEVLFQEVVGEAGDRVNTFLAVLFLAHRGQVNLQQDDLFGDLWVQDPAAISESTEAVADGGEVNNTARLSSNEQSEGSRNVERD